MTVTSSATTASSVKFASASQTSGRVIQATDIDALTTGSISYFISNSSNTGTRTISHFENQHASAVNATVVEVKQGAAERALFVNQDANGIGIEIDSEATTEACFRITAPAITTGNCIQVTDANALTSGSIVFVGSNNASFSGELINATVDNASATGTVATFKNDGTGNALFIDQDGDGTALFIDQDGDGIAFRIDSESTSAVPVSWAFDALEGANGFDLTSNSADTSARKLLSIVNDNALATGTSSLRVQQDSTGNAIMIDQNGNGVAQSIDTEATTAFGFTVEADVMTSGTVGSFYTNSSSFTGTALRAYIDHVSASGDALLAFNDGTGNAIFVDQNGNGIGINIDSEATSAVGVQVDTESSSASAVRMLKGTQDAPFFDFVATADGDATSAISTLTTSGGTTHHIQIDINGTKAWIAASTTNPS